MSQKMIAELVTALTEPPSADMSAIPQLIEKIGIPFSEKEVEQVFSVIDDEDGGSID